jgi:hypothetical protein
MSNKYTAEIGAKDAGYTSTIKQINESTKSMDSTTKQVASSVGSSFASMVKAGAAMAVGFGAIKLAVDAVKGVFNEFGDALKLGGELSDLSSRTGETAGNILILQRAFDNAGSSAEKVGPTINKLQKFMDDAAQGGAKQAETLSRLGVSLEELKGKTPLEQMQILAQRISSIEDPTQKASLAMQIFGKSGGELLPMLQNFSGEIDNAKAQLGTMPEVMNRSNASFDAISDNIEVIKTKVRDFAAGFLDRLAPAIEYATTMLTRFDAAALGMKFGDVLAGAGNGIAGFTDALKALSMGELSLSWDIAMTSMKLSATEAFNSIYKNIVASISAAGAFMKEMFGTESGIFNALALGFDIIGLKLQKSIAGAFIGIVKEIPGIGEDMAKSIENSIKGIDTKIATASEQMKNRMGEIPGDFVRGIEAAGNAFDKSLATAKDLVSTTGMQADLEKQRAILQEKIAADKANEATNANQVVKKQHEAATIQEKIAAINESIVDLEQAIVQAKQDGNKQREIELGKQKAYFEELKRSLELGLSEEEAIKNATKARADYVKEIAASEKEVTAELQKQLSLSEDMLGTIERMKQEKAIDPKGRLQNEFAEAQAEGNIRQMERISRQIKGREEEVNLQEEFKKATGKEEKAARTSIQDMAKELGIDTFGKGSKQLREDVKAELEKRKNEEVEKAKKEAPATPKEAKQEQQQEKLGGVVGEILSVCREISTKLPQTALGY